MTTQQYTAKQLRAEASFAEVLGDGSITAQMLRQAAQDAERLEWLEAHTGHNLVSDDASQWAVSGDGFQPVPETDGFKDDVSIVTFVEPQQWKPSIREAIDAARMQEKARD